MAGLEPRVRRAAMAELRRDRLDPLFDPLCPQAEQRDRVLVLGAGADLAAMSDRRLEALGVTDLDATRRLLADAHARLASLGLARLIHQRALVCDGHGLLAYVDVLTDRPLTSRARQVLKAELDELRQHLRVRAALLDTPAGSPGLAEAVLAAHPRPVFMVGAPTRVRCMNAAATARLSTDPSLAAELGALGPDGSARFEVVELRGTPARRLVVERPAPRDPLAALPDHHGLGPRTLDVVRLLAGGLSNKEIAAELGVADNTVEYHLTRTYAALGLRSRLELLALLTRPV